MEKIISTAFFGGSFDPLHFGHIDIVKNLSKRFDEVLVVPCKISPFKQDISLTDPKLRLAMLKKAFEGLQNVKIVNSELKGEGVSYTDVTVQKLAKKYPNIHVVIGSEEVPYLYKWHNIDELKKQVVFYVVPRPGFETESAVLARLKKDRFKIKNAPFKGLELSSSLIKLDLAFDKPNYFMPDDVCEIVRKNGLYNGYAYYVSGYADFNMSNARANHSYRAVKEGIRLAKRYGADTDKVMVALLLHDIGKYADREKLKKDGYVFPEGFDLLPEACKHAALSRIIADNLFEVKDTDILNAIEYHTTGRPDMTLTEKIVFIADYTEEGREFENLDEIRDAVNQDVDIGLEYILENTLRYLDKKAEEVSVVSNNAYEFYKSLNAERAEKDRAQLDSKPMKKTKSAAKTNKPKSAPSDTAFDFTAEIAKNNSAKPEAPVQSFGLVSDKYSLADKYSEHELALYISACLSDKKGREITLINLSGKTIIADYFVLCSATSTTQVKALADYVDEKLSKTYKIEPLRRDIDSKWAAVDYGAVIVHIFYEETRKFYQLERLWVDGNNVENFQD